MTAGRVNVLSVRKLSKSFRTAKGAISVLDAVDRSIARGEFLTLFGPNGSGKTTLMNIIGGIESADAGSVELQIAARTKLAIVPQDFRSSLLPWYSALDNILFPLRLQHVPRREAVRRFEQLIGQFGIVIDPDARAYTLSGGQAQWICLLRALITEPEVLLLDEPFSALDFQTSMTLRDNLLGLWQRLGLTVLMISHDLDEALYLADRTAFIRRRPGRIMHILPSTLPRPRQPGIVASIEFAKLKADALAAFQQCLL